MPTRVSSLLLWMGLLLAPASLLAQQPPQAPEIHTFSIQQAIDYASKNNAQVKNALLSVQLQQQVNREVTGSAYPQINGSGSMTYNAKLPVSLVPAEFFGGQPGEFAQLAFGVPWNATYGISFNQILFDGQVFTGLQARKTLIDYANKNAEISEEMIRANIYKVYYQLVVAQTQVELLDSNLILYKKQLRDVQIMYDNGFAERLDIDRTSVNIANVETSRLTVLNNMANGYLGLKVLMGMPIKDSLVLTDTLSNEQVKEGVLEAADFNYAQRRDFQAAEMSLKLQEYNIQRYKYGKIPTLSLNGYYNRNAQRNKFDFGKGPWFDISAFTLDLKIPIFKGFATNAKIAQEKIKWQQQVNQREALKLTIDNELAQARNNFTVAIANLDNQTKNMQLAQTVYAQTKKKFEVGTGSQSEIDIAQNSLQTAQNNYVNALYNAIIARVDFMKASGKL